MAFTKTSNPVWYIDDTPANIAAAMLAEKLDKQDVMVSGTSDTGGNLFVIVKKTSSRYL